MSTPAKAPEHFRNRQERLRDHAEGYVEMKADVTLFFDGLKTEARVTLTGDKGEETFYGEGIARCRPTDHYDRELGEQIAFLRGLKEATEDALLHAIDQTQTEGEYQREQDAVRNAESRASAEASIRSLADLIDALVRSGTKPLAVGVPVPKSPTLSLDGLYDKPYIAPKPKKDDGCPCGNPDCLFNYRGSRN